MSDNGGMRAIVYERYGGPAVLALRDVEEPTPGEGEVLVRVRAASLNALDWHFTTGTPYVMRAMSGIRRPKRNIPGVDLAGTIVSVGPGVHHLSPGDEVFGSAIGSCAELAVAPAARVVPKPSAVTFEQAAATPVAAITALQGLTEHGGVEPGHHVLINGGAGGVGTFAVQIAKALGAEVTAVCSTRNVDLVRSLGADHVVDYTTEDFVDRGGRYDVMFDNVGNRSPAALRRILADDAVCVVITGPKHRVLGPIPHVVRTIVYFKFAGPRAVSFTAEESAERLSAVAELLETGAVEPFVERTYRLEETAEALAYIGTAHTRGKLVILP